MTRRRFGKRKATGEIGKMGEAAHGCRPLPSRGGEASAIIRVGSAADSREERPLTGKEATVSTTITKTWRLLPHDRAAVDRLSAALQVAPVVAQLLLNRGLDAPE